MLSKDLIALAERVEAASGPDEELDVLIRNAVFVVCLNGAAPYTASIDAAMSLVPEGWGNVGTYPWIAKQQQDRWQAGVSAPGSEKRPPVCYAATPALALTAAALRCLAQMEEPNDIHSDH